MAENTKTDNPLFIPLKREFFNAFKNGEKKYELRPFGPRWNERTVYYGRRVVLSLGYGKQERIGGRVLSLNNDRSQSRTEAWRKCYGDQVRDVAVIEIELD